MIKVLLTSLAVPSHLWTMVIPTARALAAAGHEVTVATAAPMADEAGAGVPMLPLQRMFTQDQLAADPELAARAGFGGQGTLADDPDATPASRFGRSTPSSRPTPAASPTSVSRCPSTPPPRPPPTSPTPRAR